MSAGTTTAARRGLAGMLGVLLAAGALALVPATARADSAPDPVTPGNPVTVTADGLPTTQIDGVAWSQVVVGDTVYVAGRFGRARPAGAAAGTQETVRNNLLAYDIRTGQLVTSFAPDLNGQALVVTASPDGSRIYVGGDFTRANGQTRNRIAAYSTATGQLVADFRPSAGSQVRAIAATNTTVYLGGAFTSVGSVSRHRLAAVSAADGALLPWNPVPGPGPVLNRDDNTGTSDVVRALVLTDGGTQVVAGGHFDTLNGVKSTGVGALDAVTGATRPFAVNRLITNQGVNGAVYDLSTDGTNVYGVAYDYFGPGNLEGAFSARSAGGELNWINECHGDSYSARPLNGALYLAGHPHVCGNIGGYPEQNPRVHRYAIALSLQATGTVGTSTLYNSRVMPDGTVVHRNAPGGYPSSGTLLQGKPAPSLLNWFPTMAPGSITGQGQAAWSVAGNDRYVVYGGEFPRVNGTGQSGLVRFAVPAIAPNRIGPDGSGMAAAADSPMGGMARVSWNTANDRDNEFLTYRVYRDGSTTPLYEATRSSLWWRSQPMGFVDTAVTAGSHTYRVSAFDAFGNRANSATVSVEVAAGSVPRRAYADAVRADGASSYWPLGEPSGTTAYDHAGRSDLTVGSGVTAGQAGALTGDPDTAYRFGGTSTGLAATRTAVPGPNTFTVEAWFRTTSTTGGKIVGFGNAATGTSSNYDRHVYLETDGRLTFGVNPGSRRTVTSPAAVNDGQWHHVAASLSPAGMALHVDGRLVGSRADTTSAQSYSGYWRIGGDAGWTGTGWFDGVVDDVAVYPAALTTGQVAAHHGLGTGTAAPVPPTAEFTSTAVELTATFDAAASGDADGTIASYAWQFGDGATGSGVGPSHTYATAGTYPVTLTVTDDDGLTASSTRQVAVTGPAGPQQPAPLATDAFERAVTGGLGAADVGGTWTVGAGAARQSVAGGAAVLTVGPGNNTGSYLGAVSAPEADVRATVSVSQVGSGGSGAFVYVTGRRVATNLEYRARVVVSATGSVNVGVSRLSGTATETVIGATTTLPGVTYTPGTPLELRLRVTGSAPTTLDLTVWPAGTAEPSTPTISRTDTTAALQAPGGVGLAAYLSASSTSPVTVRFDDLRVTTPGNAQPPADQAPTAAFTATPSGLAVAVDGAGSADPDGSIASWAWTFGDGGTGSGRTASHTYATAGTYPVTLTVTDDDGLTDSVTRQVTVSAPGGPQQPTPLAADAFERSVTGGLGTADVGGAWTAAAGAARHAVTGGGGVLTVNPGNNTGSWLGVLGPADVGVRSTVSFSAVPTAGTGAYAYVTGRRVGANLEYRARLRVLPDGSVGIALTRLSGTATETVLGAVTTLGGGAYVPGAPLAVRLQVTGTGTTTLALTVWRAGTTEPTTPTLVRTDTTAALQAPGGVGLAAYLSGSATGSVAVRFDDLVVTPAP
jgi:PKD repeat protein